jgi:hypothetical protein
MKTTLGSPLCRLATVLVLYFGTLLPSGAQTNDVDVRKTLEAVISDDSGGAIILKRFAMAEEKRGTEDGRAFIRAEYKAEIEFQISGVWQFFPPKDKLSFRISVPPDFARAGGGNVAKMVAESKWYESHSGVSVTRGGRSTINGFLVFAASDKGWRLVRNQFDIYFGADPWMLPAEPDSSAGSTATPLTPEQERLIKNNLHLLESTANQYYLDTGKDRATYDDLVGPTKYIISLKRVAGEDYTVIRFEVGRPLVVTTASGEKVAYGGF